MNNTEEKQLRSLFEQMFPQDGELPDWTLRLFEQYRIEQYHKEQEHLRSLAKIAGKFLRAQGGMENGYDTYINGTLSINTQGVLDYLTPICDDITPRVRKSNSRVLEDKLRAYMKSNDIKKIRFFSELIDQGIYLTKVSITIEEEVEI